MSPRDNKNKPSPPPAPPRYYLFLYFDAAAYMVIFFKGVEAALLISEGVYTPAVGISYCIFWLAALALLSAANIKFHPEWSRVKKAVVPLVDIMLLAGVMAAANRVAALPPIKGIDTLWISNQWEMMPRNWWLMASISPGWALLEAAAAAALIRVLSLRARAVTVILTLAVIILVGVQINAFPAGKKGPVYFVIFLTPFVLSLFAAICSMPRYYSRFLAGAGLGLLIFWSYSSFIPHMPPSGFERLPGVMKIYPRQGMKPEFPLAFMRDFEIDPPHNAIFTTYGPACGVAKIDMASGHANVIDDTGLIRFLRMSPDSNYIYGTDWDKTELAVITKEPFEIAASRDLFGGGVVALWDHALDGNDHYVGTTEYAGLAKYTSDTPGGPLKRRAFLNFHELGLMKFKASTQGLCIHPKTRTLYIQIGMIDTSDKYAVLAVNPDTMKVINKGYIPEGGLELTLIPEHNSLISAAFYSDNLYELDATTLKVRRTFKGPLNSRNVVYDPARDLLYALSFLEGRLYVIRYPDMQTLFHVPIGNRPNSLALWPEKDILFAGSREGIFRINLKRFLTPVVSRLPKQPRPAPEMN